MGITLAVGSAPFVRQMELGGAAGRVVAPGEAAAELEQAIREPDCSLILLESTLVADLPGDTYENVFSSREPTVVAVGGSMNEVLRRRIREVVGADLLGARGSQ